MDWKETRKAIIEIREELKEKLLEEWHWRINLRGAYLGGASLRGADLRGADLRGAYLSGADLGGADLGGAHLGGASLCGASLRGAYLRGAYLRSAYLGGADLRGADLRGADLRGADLRGADLNWTSHDTMAELLRREAGEDINRLKLAGLVLLMREWCWKHFLGLDDPLKEWALKALAQYVTDGDDAPDVIKKYATQEKPEEKEEAETQ